jgi:putative ABC transport system substrate-binding protein
MTLGNMRQNSVRTLHAWCRGRGCNYHVVVDVRAVHDDIPCHRSVAYGANLETYFPRAIIMAHEILNGAKAGDIPVERPTRYELVINLKTARAFGLTVPVTLQVAADEVIE